MRKICLILGVLALLCGCRTMHPPQPADAFVPPPEMPRELNKVVLPPYTVEPPDILVIEAIHIVPKSPYMLRTGDVVTINVLGTLPDAPISGSYTIQPGGVISLGNPYGAVNVAGKTSEQAAEEIRRLLAIHIREPMVTLSLVEIAGAQQIAGQHLVGPDGTVTLGSYGSVPVVGMTLAQAKQALEMHLRQFLEDPEVAVDVYAYNSKVYYVITEGAGLGDGVTRFPITGNETVLDAISNINGLTQVSSKRIWIARAAPNGNELVILPVDWQAITAQGTALTNYQILPGDRVFVAEDHLVAFDTHLAKLLAPLERGAGFILLGTGTVSRLSGPVLKGGGLRGSSLGGGGVF
jgi:polysaccharide export outer membrane protein